MTTARPAYEDVTLAAGPVPVRLRPTLRAAATLEREAGGLPALLDALDGFRLGTITRVIRASATDETTAERLLDSYRDRPLAPFREAVLPAVLIVGPRAAGKTSLARRIAGSELQLDVPSARTLAEEDPDEA